MQGWESGPRQSTATSTGRHERVNRTFSGAHHPANDWSKDEREAPRPAGKTWERAQAHQEPREDAGWGGGKSGNRSEPPAAATSRFEGKKADTRGSLWVPDTTPDGEDRPHT